MLTSPLYNTDPTPCPSPTMGGEYEGAPTMGGEFVFPTMGGSSFPYDEREFVFPMMGREFLGIFPYDGRGVPKRFPAQWESLMYSPPLKGRG